MLDRFSVLKPMAGFMVSDDVLQDPTEHHLMRSVKEKKQNSETLTHYKCIPPLRGTLGRGEASRHSFWGLFFIMTCFSISWLKKSRHSFKNRANGHFQPPEHRFGSREAPGKAYRVPPGDGLRL